MDQDQEKETLPLFGGRETPENEASSGDGSAPASESGSSVPKPVAEERPRLRIQVNDVGEALSFGEYLRRLREENHLTIAQIADETKIRETYLEALENEDYSTLPPTAYVLGYVRKLCSMYGVSDDRADAITAGLREQLEYELPEDITKTVIDHEISEESERKLRQLVVLFTAAGVLIVVVLIAAGILLLASLHGSGEGSETEFNAEALLRISPAIELNMTELKP